jgi:ethanolamine permease
VITLVVFVAFLAYFWFYSRHHLVGVAPEEEFEAINRAESELS